MNLELAKFGTIYTFVDFGNVNKWFDKDVWGPDGERLSSTEKLIVDIGKLANFTGQFSTRKFFYYGFDQSMKASLHIKKSAKNNGFKTIAKPIQWIKDRADNKLRLIPKCNFDVEICLDIVRLIDFYDSICIFTSDNDFCLLLGYLQRKKKKVILISRQPIRRSLKEKDLAVARSGNRTRILEQGS